MLLATPTLIADRFEVLGLAGAGGSASVYRALDRHAKSVVAVKLLRSSPQAEDVERFAREAALLAQLSHPGIVRYVDHGREQGELYLAMEWLEGATLAQRLAKRPLTIEESIAVTRGVADALAVAHARGVVHRDVKPGNIFLVADDPAKTKLLDFGIARLGLGAGELTQTGVLIGTPGYISPEQARGAELDARADVFSLGCVLFRCLTGRGAFSGADIVAVLTKVLLEDAPLVRQLRPEVPVAIEQLVAAMLAKRAEERPADGARVSAAITSLQSHTAPAAPIRPTEALGTDERRMMCILLSRAPTGSAAPAVTIGDTIRSAVAAQGGQVDVLADRSLLVTVETTGTPTDSASRAARCALAIRSLLPTLPVVLVAGEGQMRGSFAMGPVIDRGAALLQAADERGPVQIDEVIAGFLDARFDVRQAGGVITLVGERTTPSMARSFLGRPSTCVGRERDLAMIEGVWAETVDDSVSRIVLVTGAAGIGKSRLLDEFLRKVGEADERPSVWTARGDPMNARTRFSMIADPIRQAAGIRTGDPIKDRQHKLERLVRAAVPDEAVTRVTEFLGEIAAAPVTENESVELSAARRDAQLMADQTRRAWEDWLDAEARRGPILLVLEDLQWGDVASVQFVDAAARHLAKRPFMVLALARPEVYDQFPNIWTERSLTEMRLRGLTEKAATRLVRDALGAAAKDAVIDRIVERGEGNAFFLEELLRAEIDGKGGELPTTVVAMVQARLSALSGEARRFLRAASVFGRLFSFDGVLALLGSGEEAEARHRSLVELVDKDVVQRSVEVGWAGELAFRHAIVHEAAYAMLTDADRTVGHRLAAEYLEGAGQSDPAVLAEHFERGGEASRASGWYLRAAEQALKSHDQVAAIRYVGHAIRCGARGPEEGALRLIESEARRWRGENQLARDTALAAMSLLPLGSTSWCNAASQLATVSGALGDTDRLIELAAELRQIAPEAASSALVDALARVARPLFWAGKLALASEVLGRADSVAEQAQQVQLTALAALHMARGVEARLLGDPSKCVACNELAVSASERAGDLRGSCVARGNLGYAFLEIGAFEDAERALTETLVTARRLDVPLVVATAQQNLGIALARRGAFEQAIRLEHASLTAFEAQGDRRRAGCSLLYLALVRVAEGRLDDAETAAAGAIELLALNPPLRCNILAVQAEIAFARGDTATAIARASDAWTIFSELGSVDEGESRIRLVHAEALFAAGEGEAGLAALADARACLLARAERIDDPARRRAFLEAIPENARTLARAEGR